jgi:hypothetical protein
MIYPLHLVNIEQEGTADVLKRSFDWLKIIFIIILSFHGLIHSMGFLKAFHLAKVDQLIMPISRPLGVGWLLSAILFLLSALLFAYGKSWRGFVVIPAIVFIASTDYLLLV